jgi:hypothetical protein
MGKKYDCESPTKLSSTQTAKIETSTSRCLSKARNGFFQILP